MAYYVVEFGKDGRRVEPDGRLDAAAFHRNHEAIWQVLARFLHGRSGDVVEIGSGTGQHVAEFARHTPDIIWWPSDLNEVHLKSIDAWRTYIGCDNVRAPRRIDAAAPSWSDDLLGAGGPGSLLALFCANMIHIAPWHVAEGLFEGTARCHRPDGRMFLYGPFKKNGRHTAISNAVFDTKLREGNPDWGVRDVEDLAQLATKVGLTLIETIEMPANNLILVFARV